MNSINLGKMSWLTVSVLVSLTLAQTSLFAADSRWKNPPVDGLLGNVDNWDRAPVTGDRLMLAGSTTTSLTNDLADGFKINWLFESGGTTSYTIGGNRIEVLQIRNNNPGSTQTFNLDMLLNADANFDGTASGGSIIINGQLIIGGSGDRRLNTGVTGTLSIASVNTGTNGFKLNNPAEKGQLYGTDNNTNATVIIGDIIGTTGNFQNYSLGKVYLTGSNSYTGNTILGNHSYTELVYTGTDDKKLSPTAQLYMYNSKLVLTGGGVAEKISSLQLGRSDSFGLGENVITRSSGSSSIYLTGNVGRNGDSTLNIGGDNVFGFATANALGTVYDQANANIIPTWVTINGRDWAVRDSVTGMLRALTAGEYTAVTPGLVNRAAHGLLVNGSVAINHDLQLSTLKINTAAGAGELNVSAGGLVTLYAGGLIFDGDNDYTIHGAAGTVLRPAYDSVYTINSWVNGAGTLNLDINLADLSHFTKSGAGTLMLSGSNTYRNDKQVNFFSGTVILNNDYALNDKDISGITLRVDVGTLDLNGHNAAVKKIFGQTDGKYTITNSDAANRADFIVGSATAGANYNESNIGLSGLSGRTKLTGNLRLVIWGWTDTALAMSYAQDFTGGVVLNGYENRRAYNPNNPAEIIYGVVSVSNLGYMGSGTVEFGRYGGFWLGYNAGNWNNDILVSGPGNFIFSEYGGNNFNSTGAWHGTGDIEFITGDNGGNFTLSGNMSDFYGTLKVGAQIRNSNAVNRGGRTVLDGSARDTMQNAKVVLYYNNESGAANADRNVALVFNGAGNYTVNLGDLSTGNAFDSTNTFNRGQAVVSNIGAANSTASLTVGNLGLSSTFAGRIIDSGYYNNDGSALVGTVTGAKIAVEKVGTGTWALSGSNSYSGATTVSGGVLLLSGSGQINSTSDIAVNSGGMLQQDSDVALTRKVNVNAGGVLGGSGVINTEDVYFNASTAGVTGGGLGEVGTLTLSGDQWWDNFTYNFDILSVSDHDLLNFTGLGLDLLGAQYTLNVNNLGGLTDFTDVTIISGLNLSRFGNNDALLNLWVLPNSDYSLSVSGNNLLLSYTTIPEPSTWLLLGLGTTLMVVLRRRK